MCPHQESDVLGHVLAPWSLALEPKLHSQLPNQRLLVAETQADTSQYPSAPSTTNSFPQSTDRSSSARSFQMAVQTALRCLLLRSEARPRSFAASDSPSAPRPTPPRVPPVALRSLTPGGLPSAPGGPPRPRRVSRPAAWPPKGLSLHLCRQLPVDLSPHPQTPEGYRLQRWAPGGPSPRHIQRPPGGPSPRHIQRPPGGPSLRSRCRTREGFSLRPFRRPEGLNIHPCRHPSEDLSLGLHPLSLVFCWTKLLSNKSLPFVPPQSCLLLPQFLILAVTRSFYHDALIIQRDLIVTEIHPVHYLAETENRGQFFTGACLMDTSDNSPVLKKQKREWQLERRFRPDDVAQCSDQVLHIWFIWFNV